MSPGGDAVIIRPASKSDSRSIAELFILSSDGIAEYIWRQVAERDESTLDAGTRRYAREDVDFSYQNCLIAAAGGRVAGMAHAYPMRVDPAAEPERDPVLRPYADLEDDGSLYLSGLAVFDAHRNAGIGTRLLQATMARAAAAGLPRVSLICFEANTGAMRMYRRHGFRELDRRALVPHPCLHYTEGDAVLLCADVPTR